MLNGKGLSEAGEQICEEAGALVVAAAAMQDEEAARAGVTVRAQQRGAASCHRPAARGTKKASEGACVVREM